MLKILIVIAFPIILYSCSENSYVEYKPHYKSANNEHQYCGEPELDSVEFYNTLQVLKYYGNPYKTINGKVILITEELNNDWSVLYNYTKKANDLDWLSNHKPDNKTTPN